MAIRLAGPPRSTVAEDLGAARTILDRMGQREQLRQDRQSVNDFITENIRLSGINETLPPEVQLSPDEVSQRAAANITNKGAQFDKGIAGGFQKFSSRFTGGPSTVLTGPIAEGLLNQPTGIRKDLIKAQIEASQALTQRRGELTATERKAQETADTKKSLVIKGLSTSFNKSLKGQPKIDRKGSLADNIYGEEAYNSVMKDAQANREAFGLSAAETAGFVNQWWDNKYDTRKGKTWQHVQDRQAFAPEKPVTPEEQAAISQIDPAVFDEITAAVYDGTLTPEEIKTIEVGLKADPTKADAVLQLIRTRKGQ